jgi:hypothetical protein
MVSGILATKINKNKLEPLAAKQKLQRPGTQQNKLGLQDFLDESQKISRQKTEAQADILAQETKGVAEEFAGELYGTNVGALSGVGRQLATRAVGEQAKRLEPYSRQQAAESARQELEFRREEEGRIRSEETRQRENLFNQFLQGSVDKSQISDEQWAEMGITNPSAVRTLSEVDLRNTMISEGLDPNNPQDIETFKTNLRDQSKNNLRQQVISNYAAANQGRIPDSQTLEMMMTIFGFGTGMMTQEEQDAMIAKYNEDQWKKAEALAKAQNPPAGKVLCTELHAQGLLDDEVYSSDKEMGEIFAYCEPLVVIGYHAWAKPLVSLIKRSNLVVILLQPFIKAWAYEMHFIVTGNGKSTLLGSLLQKIGVPICKFIGKLITKKRRVSCLYR